MTFFIIILLLLAVVTILLLIAFGKTGRSRWVGTSGRWVNPDQSQRP